jgi:hypothetical protein
MLAAYRLDGSVLYWRVAGNSSVGPTAQAILRPMGFGEVLDKTFSIYRSRFLLFAGIAALPAIVMLGINFADLAWWHVRLLVHPHRQPGVFLWSFAVGLGYYHISGFLGILILPAFVQACSNLLFGENTSLRTSLRFAAVRWRTYLWIAVLKMCAVLVIPEIVAFCILAGIVFALDKMGLLEGAGSVAAGGAVLLVILGAFVLFLWAGACFAYAIPVAALEGPAGWKALRRSWILSRKGRWRVAVAWVMTQLCGAALNTTVVFVALWIAILHYRGQHYAGFNNNVYLAVIYFLYAVIASVVAPLYPVAVTLLYYDQRVRKEGYDLEKMLDAAGQTAPAVAGAGTVGQH